MTDEEAYREIVAEISSLMLGKPISQIMAALDEEFIVAGLEVDGDNIVAVADNISKGIEQPG